MRKFLADLHTVFDKHQGHVV